MNTNFLKITNKNSQKYWGVSNLGFFFTGIGDFFRSLIFLKRIEFCYIIYTHIMSFLSSKLAFFRSGYLSRRLRVFQIRGFLSRYRGYFKIFGSRGTRIFHIWIFIPKQGFFKSCFFKEMENFSRYGNFYRGIRDFLLISRIVDFENFENFPLNDSGKRRFLFPEWIFFLGMVFCKKMVIFSK